MLQRDPCRVSTTCPARARAASCGCSPRALDGRDWLLGDRFTVADVMCASGLGGAHSRKLLTECPVLEAYVERGPLRAAFIQAAEISNQPQR
jgi:glutathione S-transferase